MFEFLQPKIFGFGIDLSDLSIKIVDLKKERDGFSVASFGRTEIPEGLIEGGDIKKEDELIEVIKKAVRETSKGKIKNKYCVASLPETESFVRMVQLPPMKDEEVAEAIKWELEAQIPLSLEEIYYDWQIIKPLSGLAVSQEGGESGKSKNLDILIGVLPKKTIDPYLAVFKKAGLHPFVFEIESIATTRALIKNGFSPAPVLIIDLGAKRTGVLIFYGQAIYFTSSLSISNKSLVSKLSEDLRISPVKAKQIKMKVGLDLKRPKSPVFKSLKPPLLEMTCKIKNYIDYFQEHILKNQANIADINELIICGGGANMDGLADFLSSELNLKACIGNPLVNILNKDADNIVGMDAANFLSYTTALGLALRGRQ